MKISGVEPYVPRNRVPTNNGRLILEAGDKWGDELSSAVGEGDGSGLNDEDSPGLDVRARLEGRALLERLCGIGEGARGPILV